MIQLNYRTKKELKENIGKPLRYTETSMFGPEYRENGSITGCNEKRNWFARVTMVNGLINKVA